MLSSIAIRELRGSLSARSIVFQNSFCHHILSSFPGVFRELWASVSGIQFNLNEKQHHAFEEHAFRLLQYYCNTDENGTGRYKQRNSVMAGIPLSSSNMILGPPGVGKSTFTVAIQAFARAWKQPNSVIVAAFTHAASNNARGQTLHAAFNLPTMNGRMIFSTKKTYRSR